MLIDAISIAYTLYVVLDTCIYLFSSAVMSLENYSPRSLHEKLEEIAQIEEEHGFLGVSIQTKDPELPLQTDQVIDHVLATLKRTVELKEQRERGEIEVRPAVS